MPRKVKVTAPDVGRRSCEMCDVDNHEECPATVLNTDGQYAACGCTCGGGLEAWVAWSR